MPYNVKLIEYPNGEKQVRRYSSPLESKEASCYEDDKEFGKLWFKECQELWELRDESDSYDSLIRFISELS